MAELRQIKFINYYNVEGLIIVGGNVLEFL